MPIRDPETFEKITGRRKEDRALAGVAAHMNGGSSMGFLHSVLLSPDGEYEDDHSQMLLEAKVVNDKYSPMVSGSKSISEPYRQEIERLETVFLKFSTSEEYLYPSMIEMCSINGWSTFYVADKVSKGKMTEQQPSELDWQLQRCAMTMDRRQELKGLQARLQTTTGTPSAKELLELNKRKRLLGLSDVILYEVGNGDRGYRYARLEEYTHLDDLWSFKYNLSSNI